MANNFVYLLFIDGFRLIKMGDSSILKINVINQKENIIGNFLTPNKQQKELNSTEYDTVQ